MTVGRTPHLRSYQRGVVFHQALRFGAVGTIGFAIDTAVVYGSRQALGLYGAGALAFLVAASANWALNRAWTFRGQGAGRARAQWARYLAINLVGFAVNRGAYAAVVTLSTAAAAEPILATAASALAGMGLNFTLSRRLVFR